MTSPLKFASLPTAGGESGYRPAAPPPLLEIALTTILAIWACFLPWAFGTMHVWSQLTALGLAALAASVALAPRADVRRKWDQLARSPFVWLAVLIGVYVAVQGLNPAWAFRKSTTHWWMEKRDAIPWLPSGTEAPFARMNQWRWLTIWGATFLAGAAAWVGLTNRKTIRALLVVLALNTTAVAALALAQVLSGTKSIFWVFHFPGAAGPFGSFVYKNHAAAFLLVGFGVTCALVWHFHSVGIAKGARSTPAPLFVFFACVQAAALVLSFSRLGTLLGAGSAIAFVAFATLHRRSSLHFKIALTMITLGTAAILWPLARSDASLAWQRLTGLVSDGGLEASQVRIYAYEATRRMIGDYRWFGVGAGGFRHLAPVYVKDFPVITQGPGFGPHGGMQIKTVALHESHSDVLQLFAELGLVGGSLLLALVSCSFAATSQRARRRHAIGFMAFVTSVLLLLFSWFDFPLHNPAVLGTHVLLVVLACRWSETEEMRPDKPGIHH